MGITPRANIRHSFALTAIALAAAGALLVSCQMADKTEPGATVVATAVKAAPAPALHGIHAEQLATAMGELNRFTTGQSAIARLYNDAQSGADLSEIAGTAAKISQTADALPAALEGLELSADDQAKFRELAAKLGAQATILTQQAQANNLAGARAAIGEMNGTCNACHTLYRAE